MTVKVCVTGGSGYVPSWLVMKLLQRGYTVHVTSRYLGQRNIHMLKNLAGADVRLKLFETELLDTDEVLQAIQGCHYVFHMATPYTHTLNEFKNTVEAAVVAVKCIIEACVKSCTVKRIIYTSSVLSCSPFFKDDSNSLYRDSVDESCWTSIDTELPLANLFLSEYTRSKTVVEKELLKYSESGEIDVVCIASGLVGGDTLHATSAGSLAELISQIKENEVDYGTLRFIEEMVGKVPFVHIEDITNAHIYCMENSSVKGRFLCANSYLKTVEISNRLKKYFPEMDIPQRFIVDTERTISWGSTKLEDAGFRYEYDTDETLKDSVKCAIRLGELTLPSLL